MSGMIRLAYRIITQDSLHFPHPVHESCILILPYFNSMELLAHALRHTPHPLQRAIRSNCRHAFLYILSASFLSAAVTFKLPDAKNFTVHERLFVRTTPISGEYMTLPSILNTSAASDSDTPCIRASTEKSPLLQTGCPETALILKSSVSMGVTDIPSCFARASILGGCCCQRQKPYSAYSGGRPFEAVHFCR